jgi:uncharacterized membrane protein YcaP (DUF421 family)
MDPGTATNDSSLWFLSIIAARTLIVLIALLLGIRIFGRREIGGMSIFDLVLVMALANAVQNAITHGSGAVLVGMVSGGVLLGANRLLASAFVRRPSLETRLTGGPVVVVQNGQLQRDHLRNEGITDDEVMTSIRSYGLSGLDEVKLAVLESDGSVSVVQMDDPKN